MKEGDCQLKDRPMPRYQQQSARAIMSLSGGREVLQASPGTGKIGLCRLQKTSSRPLIRRPATARQRQVEQEKAHCTMGHCTVRVYSGPKRTVVNVMARRAINCTYCKCYIWLPLGVCNRSAAAVACGLITPPGADSHQRLTHLHLPIR